MPTCDDLFEQVPFFSNETVLHRLLHLAVC